MTAELLIMNKSAIAMAADSAVTVGNEKTYTGVNKLFMLSNAPPMGIMIYGIADFINMPFETLIKEYRIKSENEGYKTVKTAMQNFLKFILKYAKTKSNPEQDFEMKLKFFFEGIEKEFNELKEETALDLIKNLVEEIDDEKLEIISKTKQFDEKEELFNEFISNFFSGNIEKNKTIKIHLKKLFLKSLYINSTGIVIAGFNEEDIYPSFSSYRLLTVLDGELILGESEDVENEIIPKIVPFAQREVMDTFLSGFNLDVVEDLNQFFEKTINEYPTKILNALQQNNKLKKNQLNIVRKEIKNIAKENKGILDKFQKMIQKSVHESYFPIKKSVGALPKEELGDMCESLIHITSLKSNLSDGLVSVGGDIDVAIISKGDGFIWTKRKHYFDSEINKQFFDRKNKQI